VSNASTKEFATREWLDSTSLLRGLQAGSGVGHAHNFQFMTLTSDTSRFRDERPKWAMKHKETQRAEVVLDLDQGSALFI
jgi:hypothetical protein